jgi:hypothetical protein
MGMLNEKQRIIIGALQELVYCRFSKETLEKQLTMIFGEPITIELGCEDVDYLTDWNYMFTSNNSECGGDFDIYVLMHKENRKGFDGATFMVTEINYDFFD